LPPQPLDLRATISGTPNTFRMNSIAGRFGHSDFLGSAALDLKAKPELDLRLQSTFLDLGPLVDFLLRRSGDPYTAPPSDSRALPNYVLPTDFLSRANAQVSITSATTSFVGQTYDNLILQGTLHDGRLMIDPLAFGGPDGNLTARFTIDDTASPPDVQLQLDGDQIRLAVIPGINAAAAASRYKMGIDVAAKGANVRDLAGTLAGTIRLQGTGGRVPNSMMNALSSDFLTEFVRTLNPLVKRAEYTDVVCQAYLFRANAGVLRTDPAIVFRTSTMDIVSNGTVDLRNESIDFNFKTAARSGLGFSAGELLNAYVKVTGTLAKPRLTVDPTGTLVNGGAAFATGGLSILATTLWDRLSRQKDPCAAAVAESDHRAASAGRNAR